MATGIPIELEQEYNRNKTLKKFLADHQSKINTYLPVKEQQTLFEANLIDFENIMPGKDTTTIGITDNKANRKKEIVKQYSIICLLTRSYALKYGKAELAANTNFAAFKIRAMADGEILPFVVATNARITAEALPDPLFAPYGIDAPRLATALTKATEFNNLIGKAGATKSNQSALVIALKAQNKLLRQDIDNLDLLMLHFKETDHTFYNAYLSAKAINKIGIHHAGIQGVATFGPGFTPAEGVTVVCNQKPKKKSTTDLVGHYKIIRFLAGNYSFTFTHPTLGSKTIIVKIQKGKIKTVDIHWG